MSATNVPDDTGLPPAAVKTEPSGNENPDADLLSFSALEKELARIPFVRLFQVIWDRGDLSQWNQEFHTISEHLSKIVLSHFNNFDLGWSAAQSAFRTVVRRLQGGSAADDPSRPSSEEALCLIEGPHALFGYLLMTAFDKAGQKLREEGRAASLARFEAWGFDPSQPLPEEADSQEWHEKINRRIARQYQSLLAKIRDSQTSDLRKKLVMPILLGHYRLQKISDIHLSEEIGVSAVTIRKARKAIVQQWESEVQSARQTLSSFMVQLRQTLD